MRKALLLRMWVRARAKQKNRGQGWLREARGCCRVVEHVRDVVTEVVARAGRRTSGVRTRNGMRDSRRDERGTVHRCRWHLHSCDRGGASRRVGTHAGQCRQPRKSEAVVREREREREREIVR